MERMVRAGRQHDGRGYSAPLRSTHLALPICAGVRRPSRLEAPVRKGGGRSCTRRSTYRRGKASHGAVRGVWAQRGLGSGRAGPWARLASPGDTVLWRARSWMKSVDSTRVAEAISDWQSACQQAQPCSHFAQQQAHRVLICMHSAIVNRNRSPGRGAPLLSIQALPGQTVCGCKSLDLQAFAAANRL
eukprot:SAG25_NODE_5073_length_706_cov_12.126853_1_plen_187_part_10